MGRGKANVVERIVEREFQEQLESLPWKWSKTYARFAPHWYILEEDYPEIVARMKALIAEHGKQQRFRQTTKVFTYLIIGAFKYWDYGVVLNRAAKEWY